jgi:hypothetical protein
MRIQESWLVHRLHVHRYAETVSPWTPGHLIPPRLPPVRGALQRGLPSLLSGVPGFLRARKELVLHGMRRAVSRAPGTPPVFSMSGQAGTGRVVPEPFPLQGSGGLGHIVPEIRKGSVRSRSTR